MDDIIVDVLIGSAVNGFYYGVVQSYARTVNEDSAAVQTEVKVFCMDGVSRSFTVKRDAPLTAGTVVEANVGIELPGKYILIRDEQYLKA